jgi:hypothetical protein
MSRFLPLEYAGSGSVPYRGMPIADTIVPLSAGFNGPTIWSSNLFLFAGTATVSSAVILEVTGFEVTESPNVREFNVFNLASVAVDSFIEVNDLDGRVGKGSKN